MRVACIWQSPVINCLMMLRTSRLVRRPDEGVLSQERYISQANNYLNDNPVQLTLSLPAKLNITM